MNIIKRKKIAKSIAYDDYWRFAASRQQVFFDTINGVKTVNDPIINQYKFTNCYRALDRTTQYLIKNIISDQTYDQQDIFLRTILFKIFNKIETWEAIQSRIGEITVRNFNEKHLNNLLTELRLKKIKIYSAAYIMPSGKKEWGSSVKHQNNITMIKHMLDSQMHQSIWECKNLKTVYEMFLGIGSIGKFLALQYAIDIAYSGFSLAQENQFVVAGPGAIRGIQKCFPDAKQDDYGYIIAEMAEHQESEFERLQLDFRPLKNRPLQLIDCQNLFCEVDKYLRVKRPELGIPGARIKQNYVPQKKKIEYCLPQKWKASI